jgi:hypothetical protein
VPDSITAKTGNAKIEKLGHTAVNGYGRNDKAQRRGTGPAQPRSPK